MPHLHRVAVADSQSVALDWYPAGGTRAALFVQGLGSTRRGDKATYFAQRFNEHGWSFAAPDLRGHGESDGRVSELTMSRMLADVAAVERWLETFAGIRRPVLIGSSMGGAAIAWHASRHRESTGPLVMLGPSLSFPASLIAQIGDEGMARWRDRGVTRIASKWIDVELGYGLVTDGAQYDASALAREHASPTLIIHGMHDEVVDWRASLAFARARPPGVVNVLLVAQGDHRLTTHRRLVFDAMWSWLRRYG
jgi:pimeloyl-ACP methyl ester carboxylesterase